MTATWLIARRELGAYLRTMSGYVIAAAVLFVNGILFNAFALGASTTASPPRCSASSSISPAARR